jgi:hypothetical protein
MAQGEFTKDPDAVLDYEWDWSTWLAGDTIASHTVTVPTDPTGLVLDSDSATTTTVTAWLSGGTDGESYTVTCHIVTAAGREDDRSMTFMLSER